MKVITRLSSCQICRIIFSVLILLDRSVVFDTNNKLPHEIFFPFGLYTVLILLLFLQPLWEKIEEKAREWKKAQKREKRDKEETKEEEEGEDMKVEKKERGLFMINIITS